MQKPITDCEKLTDALKLPFLNRKASKTEYIKMLKKQTTEDKTNNLQDSISLLCKKLETYTVLKEMIVKKPTVKKAT